MQLPAGEPVEDHALLRPQRMADAVRGIRWAGFTQRSAQGQPAGVDVGEDGGEVARHRDPGRAEDDHLP